MQVTFIVDVRDGPGVLNRIISLFRRREFRIASLTFGQTATPAIFRMTIVTDLDESGARWLETRLDKLLDVLRVQQITELPGPLS